MGKADSGTGKGKGRRIMPEATTKMKITEYDPAIIEKFVGSKQRIFIAITNATKDDIEYATNFYKNFGTIKQSDLRDNMAVLGYNETGELEFILRSVNSEREYQEWQEEVRKKVKAKDKRNKEREAKEIKEKE